LVLLQSWQFVMEQVMQALLKRVVPAAQVKHELAVLQRMQLEMAQATQALLKRVVVAAQVWQTLVLEQLVHPVIAQVVHPEAPLKVDPEGQTQFPPLTTNGSEQLEHTFAVSQKVQKLMLQVTQDELL
jgi:hypothetical protein